MKYSNIQGFEKHLAEAAPKHFASLYVILAKENFQKKTAIEKLSKALLAGQTHSELGITTFNAEDRSVQEITQELDTFGFFTETRVIVVNHAEKLVKAIDIFEPYFSNPPPRTYLILTADSLASNTLLYKKAEKAGIVLELAEEKPWEKEKSLQAWLVEYAAAHQKKIDPQAAHYLIKYAGLNQSVLQQEMQKLFCYIDQRPSITAHDISNVCTRISQDTIWQLVEAIFHKDCATALRINTEMLQDGTPFIGLLKQIRSQFTTDFQVSCILAANGSPADVTHQFPYMRGPLLHKHLDYAKNYGLHKFKEGLLLIDAAELNAKNSGTDPAILAEQLIIKLTT